MSTAKDENQTLAAGQISGMVRIKQRCGRVHPPRHPADLPKGYHGASRGRVHRPPCPIPWNAPLDTPWLGCRRDGATGTRLKEEEQVAKGLPSVMPGLHCVVAARRKTLEEWPSSYDAILRVRQVMYTAYIGRCEW